jgi:hypothetical protein
MPLDMRQSPSLGIRPRLPVAIRWVDGEPKIIAGGVPVVPFNAALKYRARHDGATRKSLATYAGAGALTPPTAHQGVGLLDIANDEFPSFVDGLLGLKFRNAGGEFVHLDDHARSRASADLYLTLLHSFTGYVALLPSSRNDSAVRYFIATWRSCLACATQAHDARRSQP